MMKRNFTEHCRNRTKLLKNLRPSEKKNIGKCSRCIRHWCLFNITPTNLEGSRIISRNCSFSQIDGKIFPYKNRDCI